MKKLKLEITQLTREDYILEEKSLGIKEEFNSYADMANSVMSMLFMKLHDGDEIFAGCTPEDMKNTEDYIKNFQESFEKEFGGLYEP